MHSGDGDTGEIGIHEDVTPGVKRHQFHSATTSTSDGGTSDEAQAVYMEKLWQVMQIATTQNATLTVMNNHIYSTHTGDSHPQESGRNSRRKTDSGASGNTPHPRPAGITTKVGALRVLEC